MKPPENILYSEWVEKYCKLHSIDNAEGGEISINRVEYSREWLDCRHDPALKDLTICACIQSGKSQTALYHMQIDTAEDPGPSIFVGPDQDSVEDFAEERFMTNARLCEKLKEHVQFKDKDPRNKRDNKLINGSRIHFAGANSPARLCSKPKRNCYFTEVGRYKESAGKEGSAVKITKKRSATFHDVRFHFHESSPGNKGECEITELFELGSQEYYHIPCPKCKTLQKLVFDQLKFKTKVVDGYRKYIRGSAYYECEHCKAKLKDQQINRAVSLRDKSTWIATYPERKEHRSFHLNAFYSPWITLAEIATEFVNAQGDVQALKVFINTYLAEAWEDRGEATSEHKIYNRREKYDATVILPEKVCYITAAVDMQGWGNAVEIKGWGRGEESWSLEQFLLHGDNSIMKGTTENPSIWEDLDQILANKVYTHPTGVKMRIAAVGVDTGGHYTTEVYKFCIQPHRYRCYALKGHNKKGAPLWPARPSKNNSQNCPLWMVGVNIGKDMLYSDLQKEDYGAGYCHFPDYPLEYFRQLTAEQRVQKKKNGYLVTEWTPIRKRNEATDLHVYNRAVLEGQRKNLDILSDNLGIAKLDGLKVNAIMRRRTKKKPTVTKTYRRKRRV